jgi:predicted PurR-regulated permease PerM
MTTDRFRKVFLLLLVIAITAALAVMLRDFLVTILLAAVFAGLAHPIYANLHAGILRRSRPLASAVTLLLLVLLVIAPLVGVAGIVVNQAIEVTTTVRPVVERFIEEPTFLEQQLERIPGFQWAAPYRDQILLRTGDLVDAFATVLVGWLSGATRITVTFIFHVFILLYTMFFLLMDGRAMLAAALDYLPLRATDKHQLTDRFLSVTRATLKGTIVIGIVQGGLAGLAFWVAGIPNTVFWTVVMVVLSILPVIGAALVWVPAALFLGATGQILPAILLAVFCGVVVGSIDNVLRPRLVGRDTQMHDLLILFSTLGGLFAFGPVGFIIGPILAGLFVTSWELFGQAYRDMLDGV